MIKTLTDSEIKAQDTNEIDLNGVKMPVSCAVRWILLLEALDLIEKTYEEQEKTFDYDIILDKAKPHKAITKYINERYIAALNDYCIGG